MRDAVRKKERCERRVRLPNILVLTRLGWTGPPHKRLPAHLESAHVVTVVLHVVTVVTVVAVTVVAAARADCACNTSLPT